MIRRRHAPTVSPVDPPGERPWALMRTLGSMMAAAMRRARQGATGSTASRADTGSVQHFVHAPRALRSPTSTPAPANGESEQTNADKTELMRPHRAIEHMSRRIAGQQEQMATLLRALSIAGHARSCLAGHAVRRVPTAPLAVLAQRDAIRVVALGLLCLVVPALALLAREGHSDPDVSAGHGRRAPRVVGSWMRRASIAASA